jgi:hypothetical protein
MRDSVSNLFLLGKKIMTVKNVSNNIGTVAASRVGNDNSVNLIESAAPSSCLKQGLPFLLKNGLGESHLKPPVLFHANIKLGSLQTTAPALGKPSTVKVNAEFQAPERS